jgi:hypothetical protein
MKRMSKELLSLVAVGVLAASCVAPDDTEDESLDSVESASGSGSIFCHIGLGLVDYSSKPLTKFFLGREDDWAVTLSAYDLGARQQTTDPTDLDEFLDFTQDHALSWSSSERNQWRPLVRDLRDALRGLNARLPLIFISKTTGDEELGAIAYTRDRTIFFNDDFANFPTDDPRQAFRLLAHEVFHILSRFDSHKRDQLYALLGWHGFDGFDYPAELEERRVTNPDSFHYDHAITVETPDGPRDVVVLLQQTVPLEDVIGQNFFATIDVQLLAVDVTTGDHLVDGTGAPLLYNLGNTNYVPLVLRNSAFLIAPDELLADNFATLMEWRRDGELPPDSADGFPINDPQLLVDIEAILAEGCD